MSLLPLLFAAAFAEGGMWLPEQMTELAPAWQERGLELDAESVSNALAEPLNAIVSLGFCSAAFVSPEGLVATNHHCVAGYLQHLSDAEHPHHRDGFIAPTQAEEQSVGPTGKLWVVETITDVTDEVMKGIGRRTPDGARYDRMMNNIKELEATCEEQDGRRCSVRSQFGGSTWRLYASIEIKDVRMVYAPPMAQGQYGGDVDNWQWPRHSADFSLLRAYVGPDGSPAEPSDANIPFKPKHHLTLNPQGANPGDFVMVAGFPGRTERHHLVQQSRDHIERQIPTSTALDTQALAIIDRHRAESEEADARLTSVAGSLNNRLKNRQGMVDGFAREGALATLSKEQEDFLAWIRTDKKRARTLLPLYREWVEAIEEGITRSQQNEVIGRMRRWAGLLRVAHTGIRFAQEQAKPDADRELGWQDRDEPRTRAWLKRLQTSMWLPADRELFRLLLDQHAALEPTLQLPGLDAWLDAYGGVSRALDILYDNPTLGTVEGRLALLDMSPDQLAASTDPWVQLAQLYEAWDKPERKAGKARRGRNYRLKAPWMQAKREWYAETGRVLSDDANSTLRLTLGHVQGYSPQDGLVATPQTTLAGLIAKAGEAPFDMPASVLTRAAEGPNSRWADTRLGDVPVNALTTLDVTGGNSGSAVLDGQGRYVGIAFDTTWEGVVSDRLYVGSRTRTIIADIRYMLWVLEGQEGAARLLTELGVDPQ